MPVFLVVAIRAVIGWFITQYAIMPLVRFAIVVGMVTVLLQWYVDADVLATLQSVAGVIPPELRWGFSLIRLDFGLNLLFGALIARVFIRTIRHAL